MFWFRRSLAKCLDMALFAAGMRLLLQLFGVSSLSQMMLLCILPIAFAPIEALILKLFRTTLGKSFFGLSYDRPFTFHSAFSLTFKHAILILPLFLPGVNIFFAFFYIQELSKFPKNRWDELSSETLGAYSKKRILRSAVVAFTLLFSTSIFAPKFTLNQFSKVTGIDLFIEGVNTTYSKGNITNWKKIDEVKLAATAYFPSLPEKTTEQLKVPKSPLKLDLTHYSYKDAAHDYRLSYAILPKSWTKWGPSLVLGTAINYVVDKNALVFKKKCKHHNFPALEYRLEKNGKTTTGLLVMVQDTMYRIEFEQPSQLASLDSEAEKNLLNSFFDSFQPKKQ